MRCTGHVARMGTGEVHTWFWWGDMMEGEHLVDLSGDGSTSRVGGMAGLVWLRIGTGGGLL